MATVGQQLKTPESGWKRYDDVDVNISYVGSGWKSGTYTAKDAYYLTTNHWTTINDDYACFKFTGTKLRIIGYADYKDTFTRNTELYIDGVKLGIISEYFASHTSIETSGYSLVADVSGLNDGEHSVKIILKDAPKTFCLDAIDIDSNGVLKPCTLISAPINLTATPGDAQVTLKWDAVTGATGYNVKRSLTAGGPYETITTNVSGTSYVDTNVVNGTTYYYVVTAVNVDGESPNSNEASATPQAAPVEEGNVLLRITMNDSSERQYKVTQTVVDGFISWYDRTVGTGNTCYSFDDSIDGSKEYLAFEKIISFKVIPLPAE